MSAAGIARTGAAVPDRDRASAGRRPVLPEAVRMLAAFAGIGAGAVSFGISSTLAFGAVSGWAWVGVVAAGGWGIAAIGWAVQSLRLGRIVSRRRIVVASVLAGLVHVASIFIGVWWVPAGGRTLDVAALSALGLELILLGSVGWLSSRGGLGPVSGQVQVSAGPLLAAFFLAALVVAGIATPGLAAGAAGAHAVTHGEHGAAHIPVPAGHHH